MKKLRKLLFNRMLIVGFLLLIQFAVLTLLMWKLSQDFTYIYVLFLFISFAVFLDVMRNDMNVNFKLSWCILIAVLPLFGGLFYLFFARIKAPKKIRDREKKMSKRFNEIFPHNQQEMDELKAENKDIYGQCSYIRNVTKMPVYKNTHTKYYPSGESFFADFLEELRSAERYIFLEYFIIAEGKMWDKILEILKQKAEAGLDVRVMFDDAGSINRIPYGYEKTLETYGIKAVSFNPFIPVLSIFLQNRDHRKIAVIDGHTAFTGGINIGDEYINELERFGHWKDTAVRLKGSGVFSFTLLFLHYWSFLKNDDSALDEYINESKLLAQNDACGYVQPYNDSPYNDKEVSKNVYMNIFNTAQETLYITTPYLIIDNEMINALILAAQRGVDVRIITPGIADKPLVHFTTRSYYHQLISQGVKIYEYTPGFIHAKTVIADNEVGTAGTVNLDYRSLYHHFECGVLMYKTETIADIYKDFFETLNECTEIDENFCKKRSVIYKAGQALMRIVAPLL